MEWIIMIFGNTLYPNSPLRDAITNATRQDETICINNLLEQAQFPTDGLNRINETAKNLVQSTRKNRKKQGGLDTFLHQYDLSSEEGFITHTRS
jgi:RHH-type proline utilization regulon transcriptional repressor/proline dehydrogenase/delta 1-pyrroline-5-carboxylate dehydrogenase